MNPVKCNGNSGHVEIVYDPVPALLPVVGAFCSIAGREMKRNVKCSRAASRFSDNAVRNFVPLCESDRLDICLQASVRGGRESHKGMNQELLITCVEVRRELSNYIDDEITPALRARIEEHVAACSGCRAIYDGLCNVLTLVTATELIELPRGFSVRLYLRLRQAQAN